MSEEIADFRLQIADCRLQIADLLVAGSRLIAALMECDLKIWNLQSEI